MLVIIRLSRTMRSLKHLLELVGELRERGVGLAVLKQHIDTTTPTGRLAFHIPGRSTNLARADRRGTGEGSKPPVPAGDRGRKP